MLVVLSTHPIQYQVPLWQALARDGRVPFEVWYVTDHGTRASYDREFDRTFAWDLDTRSGYPHRFLPVHRTARPSSFLECRLTARFSRDLRARGATALWIQGWQVAAYWQAAWEARRAGVELWLRAESNDMAPRPVWKRATRRIALKTLFRRVDRFLCIGTANRRLYQRYGVHRDRLYDAPYAVDNQRFATQAQTLRESRSDLRRRWGIADGSVCVLFCGKMVPKKRPLDIVEAARRTASSGSLHLLFVGSGELDAAVRRQCNVVVDEASSARKDAPRPPSLDDERPTASFAGFLNQSEISKAYAAADCLVLPSDYDETWGLVVNEAMASGLRCVISDRCGSSVDLGRAPGNETFPCGDTRRLSDVLNALATGERSGPGAAAAPPSLEETVRTVVSLSNISGNVTPEVSRS